MNVILFMQFYLKCDATLIKKHYLAQFSTTLGQLEKDRLIIWLMLSTQHVLITQL